MNGALSLTRLGRVSVMAVLLAILAVLVVSPLVMTLIASFSTQVPFSGGPPGHFTLDNYRNLFVPELATATWNTLIIAVGGTIMAVSIGATLASGRHLLASGTMPPPGSSASLCVRPEDLRLRPAGMAPPDAITGEVTLASFLGAATLYRVRTPTGEVWEVLTDSAPDGIAKGAAVTIDAPAAAMCLLPDA